MRLYVFAYIFEVTVVDKFDLQHNVQEKLGLW